MKLVNTKKQIIIKSTNQSIRVKKYQKTNILYINKPEQKKMRKNQKYNKNKETRSFES